MALTAGEQARITHRMEQLQRQKSIHELISEMGKLQEFVDKSEWDAFCNGSVVTCRRRLCGRGGELNRLVLNQTVDFPEGFVL